MKIAPKEIARAFNVDPLVRTFIEACLQQVVDEHVREMGKTARRLDALEAEIRAELSHLRAVVRDLEAADARQNVSRRQAARIIQQHKRGGF